MSSCTHQEEEFDQWADGVCIGCLLKKIEDLEAELELERELIRELEAQMPSY